MKGRILVNLNNPEKLEELYRENKHEFTKVFSEIPDDSSSDLIRFWKIRLSDPDTQKSKQDMNLEVWVVIGLGLLSGLLTRIPLFFSGMNEELFYFRNLMIIAFNGLIVYTLWQNRITRRSHIFFYIASIVLLLLFVNLLPDQKNDSVLLAYIHVPLLLWCLFGLAFVSFEANNLSRRIEFIRFNGELLVMTGLILIAAGILTALTMGLFSVIKLDIYQFCYDYIAFISCAAAPIVAFYLIRMFPGITSKIVPVLARVFTPLVLITLLVYLFTFLFSGNSLANNRELLIVFNGMLLAVMLVIVFSISELDKSKEKNPHVLILLLLAIITLVINSIALIAIINRIFDGITPNRLVVLVSNILIFINLIWISRDLFQTYFRHKNVDRVEKTIAWYLNVYAIWTVIVIFILPFIFLIFV